MTILKQFLNNKIDRNMIESITKLYEGSEYQVLVTSQLNFDSVNFQFGYNIISNFSFIRSPPPFSILA